jgi:serine/threonine-protein kinase HipA
VTQQPQDELHLWWVAALTRPVYVGPLRYVRRTAQHPGGVSLAYCADWLAHGFALSEDLPLRRQEYFPAIQDAAAGAVDDARPDRWGERVIRFLDRPDRLSTLEFLYFAGDSRFGALGVSSSPDVYLPKPSGPLPQLEDVKSINRLVQSILIGEPIPDHLRRLISPGTTLGGAQPKGLITIDGEEWVVKFTEEGDPFDTPLIEHAAMTLAARAGIRSAKTMAIPLNKRHAVAVHRFDRSRRGRIHALSAHVVLRAAASDLGYPELALLLRRRGAATLQRAHCAELFRRMVFNILIDNTDDHEKNHAVLMRDDGQYVLSPAYDVLPTAQSIGQQQIRVGVQQTESTIENALSEVSSFGLTIAQAQKMVRRVATVVSSWQVHFRETGVSTRDIEGLARSVDRVFLREQRDAWSGKPTSSPARR